LLDNIEQAFNIVKTFFGIIPQGIIILTFILIPIILAKRIYFELLNIMKERIVKKSIIAFLIMPCILAAACSDGKNNNQPIRKKITDRISAEVVVASVKKGPIVNTYNAIGTVTPKETSRIFPKVSGRIAEVFSKEGNLVLKGAPLMRIDPFDYARAAENAFALMNQAKSNLDKADRDYERIQKLYADKAVPKQNLQDMKTGVDLAKFAYDQAVAMLKKSKDDLEECSVKAPIAAIVTNKFVNPGELTSPQTLAFILMQMNVVEVEVDLPEEAFGNIETGNVAFVSFDAIPDTTVEGHIAKIHPTIDPVSRTAKITLSIDNPKLEIRAGMTARTKIVQKSKNNAMYAPRAALIPEEDHFIVYKIISDTVKKVRVDTGIIGDDVFEIKNGLTEGDTVVVLGATGLRDAMKVKVTSTSPKQM
jgi:RND family efflux transporter MFP subunit